MIYKNTKTYWTIIQHKLTQKTHACSRKQGVVSRVSTSVITVDVY